MALDKKELTELKELLKPKLTLKLSKVFMILLEAVFLGIIILSFGWFYHGLNLISAGDAEKGTLIINMTKIAIGSLSVIGTAMGVVLPAFIGMLRFFKEKQKIIEIPEIQKEPNPKG